MISFTVSPKEQATIDAWFDEHNKTCKFYDDGTSVISPAGAIGATHTFSFTPTSIGTAIKVKCACGGEINATDYDSW